MKIKSKQLKTFVNYCLSFYGEGDSIYPVGATRDDVLLATGVRLGVCACLKVPFAGDSIDREAVRDILIDQMGYVWRVAAT